jgi:hypothetical protein
MMFRKDTHYMWLIALLELLHVAFMTYFFPREWADTSQGLAFISKVATFVPVVDNLIQSLSGYNNYWGMFYSIFWVYAPLYIGLGLASSFLMQEEKRKDFISMTREKFCFLFFIIASCVMYLFFYPLLSRFYQMSGFLPLMWLGWFVTALLIYLLGVVCGFTGQRTYQRILGVKQGNEI